MDDTVHYVPVQTRQPRNDSDLGEIAEGFYKVDGDTVYLVTAQGAQRYDKKRNAIKHKLRPGEIARAVAWRLTKENIPKPSNAFNRPLVYFNHGKI